MLLAGEVAPGEASMEYLAASKKVEVVKLDSMSRRISLAKDLWSLLRLWSIFRRHKPMIVHTHTAKAGTVGRLAAIMAGVPVKVHTFHGNVFSGYFSSHVSRLFVSIERFLARYTDCVVAISDSQKKELCERYKIAPSDRIEVVQLGFELEPFLSTNVRSGLFRKSLRCRASAPLVGWVGRFAPIKGPALFVNCVAECSCRGSSAHFVMIGDGELRASCEAQIDQQKLNGILEITGWRRELPAAYSDLDVIVSTSINEGTPVALLEAMAAGKPVVATDVGGTRDLMVGSPRLLASMEIFDNAILVPREEVVLARAVHYLLDHPELRSSMGKAGREFVREKFSATRLADDLERLYVKSATAKGLFSGSQKAEWPQRVSSIAASSKSKV